MKSLVQTDFICVDGATHRTAQLSRERLHEARHQAGVRIELMVFVCTLTDGDDRNVLTLDFLVTLTANGKQQVQPNEFTLKAVYEERFLRAIRESFDGNENIELNACQAVQRTLQTIFRSQIDRQRFGQLKTRRTNHVVIKRRHRSRAFEIQPAIHLIDKK